MAVRPQTFTDVFCPKGRVFGTEARPFISHRSVWINTVTHRMEIREMVIGLTTVLALSVNQCD